MTMLLYSILRPKTLDEIVGQEQLTAIGSPFRTLVDTNKFGNFILYGPNGCGKTSIVSAISANYKVFSFNATTFSVKELRSIVKNEEFPIIHIDEIYRLTAPQADVLLPHIESSKIRLIGCTVDNPYHTLRSSLLSRCQIFTLEPLKPAALVKLIKYSIKYYKSIGHNIIIDHTAAKYFIRMVCGDGRQLISLLQIGVEVGNGHVTLELAQAICPSKYFKYTTDLRYNWMSAYQGSIQASDPDAAIYWLASALESGEDPRYIARRLLVSAAEDAFSTPLCTAVAHAAYLAACEIGRPECDIVLAQATIMIASAKRDKTAACAIWEAVRDVRDGMSIEVPKEMRDSHYPGAAQLGHGAYHDGVHQDQYIGISKKYVKPEQWGSSEPSKSR